MLSKDYPISGTSLEVKTKTPSGVTFRVSGSTPQSSTAPLNADVEATYVDPKNGFTFTQGWTTTNVLKSQIELENQIAKGLKFDLTTALHPDKGTKNALLNTTYKQPGLHARAFLDVFKVIFLLDILHFPSPLTFSLMGI